MTIHIDHSPTRDRLEELRNKSKQLEDEILLTLQQLTDPHNIASQQWIKDLLDQQTNRNTILLLNGGLIYSITAIDNVIASLLNIDNINIIKARKLRSYIKHIWQQNGYNTNILSTPMVEDENEAFSIAHQLQLLQQNPISQQIQ